jgi:phosphatidyl-myo-inositol dimannoside synthase
MPSPAPSAAALVVSEVYPPAPGGSGELIHNIYSRCPIRSTILTESIPGEPPTTAHGRARVIREPMHADSWGIAGWGPFSHHVGRARRLRQLAAAEPTVLHCCRSLPEGLDAWLAGLVGRLPYLCWVHGEELNVMDTSRELTWLFDRVRRSSMAFIANSSNTASLLKSRGVASEAIHVVRPGVDAARFRPDVSESVRLRQSLVPAGTLLLLSVGRLQQRKGHDLVIRMLASLRESDPPVRYVIVGTGPERERLEALATELGVRRLVEFVGVVPASELPTYYAAADIFLHPNRVEQGDFEGFGIVFLEAAAAGLPIIGGDSGGVPEAIERSVTGVLVSGTDVDELRREMLALCADPARRRAMGTAGRQRALREFDWATAAARVAEIHREVAERSFAR